MLTAARDPWELHGSILLPTTELPGADEPTGNPVDVIAGHSSAIQEVLAQARRVAATDATVLVLGETGTGKELIASYVLRHLIRA
jgi:transcriptional regulator with PAS, ATPase and Fis domain